VLVDVSSAYAFTSALLLGGRVEVATLLEVLKLPRCFTCILIVGVSVACTYAAALLWKTVSNLDVAIPVRAFDDLYMLQFLMVLVCVMLMMLLDLNLVCSRFGSFCVIITFVIFYVLYN
jgi:hypothetical protein